MKIDAYKINGEIYVGRLSNSHSIFSLVNVSFWLPLRQIQKLIEKSETKCLKIGKIICDKPTNAGMQKCKLISYIGSAWACQLWMDRIGMDFTEYTPDRIIHAPVKIGSFSGRGFTRIDFHNAFFALTLNKKTGKLDKSLFFSKDRKRTIEKTRVGFITPAY